MRWFISVPSIPPSTLSATLLLTTRLLVSPSRYVVDYTKATPLKKPYAWGYRRGCDVVTKACLTNGAVTSPDAKGMFCATPKAYSCSLDRRAWTSCTIATYSGDLPAQYQYFSSSTAGASWKKTGGGVNVYGKLMGSLCLCLSPFPLLKCVCVCVCVWKRINESVKQHPLP